MRAPWFIYLTFFSFALPVAAATIRRRALDRPMRLIAAWFALLVVENVVAIAIREFSDGGNNLDVAKWFLPLEALLVLPALAEWQVHALARSAVRFLVPLYLLVWLAAMRFVEREQDFSYLAQPSLGLLVLTSALVAFIARIQREDRPVLDTTWGWVLPGIAIFFAINVTTTILLGILYERGHLDMMSRALYVQSAIYLGATLLVTWGFLWPTRPRPSGASSSPSASP